MSESGEINRLAEVAHPQVGIVLNAFPAHLESMGSVENVSRAKGELLLRLQAPDGCAVVNADDPLVSALALPAGVKRVTFGSGAADARFSCVENLGIGGQRFTLHIFEAEQAVSLHAFGRHNLYNALAAAAAAHVLGVTPAMIAAGLERFQPYDKRFRLEEVNGLILIDDSYNANPASMAAALATLAELKGNHNCYVVLGDMLELGTNESELHRLVGVQAAAVASRLYLYGELSAHSAAGAVDAGMPPEAVVLGKTHEQITAEILLQAAAGDLVLIKGSRGMKMETVAEGIRSQRR